MENYKVGQEVTIIKDYGHFMKEVVGVIKKITKTHLYTSMGKVEIE
jgi:hypothetical protein|tara:strand:- start:81 stop:218 length:138 start_codon:yes stop_codon:yes gene_type:complete